ARLLARTLLLLDHALEHRADRARGLGADDLTPDGVRRVALEQHAAVGVDRALEQVRLVEPSAVRDRGEGGRELHRGHRDALTEAAGREVDVRPALDRTHDAAHLARQIHRRRAAEAEALEVAEVALAPELLGDL